jgi:hypothetical protein
MNRFNSCNGSFSILSLIRNVIAASVQDLTYCSHSSQHLAAATAALDHIDKVFATGMTGLTTCAAFRSGVGCDKLAKAGQTAANPPWWNQAPFGLVCAGLPADILDDLTALKSFRNDIASLPVFLLLKAWEDTFT